MASARPSHWPRPLPSMCCKQHASSSMMDTAGATGAWKKKFRLTNAPTAIPRSARNCLAVAEQLPHAKTVQRLMLCRNPDGGYARYVCPGCEYELLVPFSCKTRFCLSYGKVRVDNGVNNIARAYWKFPISTSPSTPTTFSGGAICSENTFERLTTSNESLQKGPAPPRTEGSLKQFAFSLPSWTCNH